MTDFDRAARSSDVAIGLADMGWGSSALYGSYLPGGLKRHVESARRTDCAARIARAAWPGGGRVDRNQGKPGRPDFLDRHPQRADPGCALLRGRGRIHPDL